MNKESGWTPQTQDRATGAYHESVPVKPYHKPTSVNWIWGSDNGTMNSTILLYKFTEISEEHVAPIFRVEE
jgi:hypothetical protein